MRTVVLVKVASHVSLMCASGGVEGREGVVCLRR